MLVALTLAIMQSRVDKLLQFRICTLPPLIILGICLSLHGIFDWSLILNRESASGGIYNLVLDQGQEWLFMCFDTSRCFIDTSPETVTHIYTQLTVYHGFTRQKYCLFVFLIQENISSFPFSLKNKGFSNSMIFPNTILQLYFNQRRRSLGSIGTYIHMNLLEIDSVDCSDC